MPPAPINRTGFAILGLLATGPKSGYAIKQRVETSIGNFWKESFGHIYPTLWRLHKAGLSEPLDTPPQNRRERHEYRLTPSGQAALHAWLAEPVAPTVARNEFALKLYFGGQVAVAITRRHVNDYREHHREALARYRSIGERLQGTAHDGAPTSFQYLTVTLGIAHCAAYIAWCDETLEQLDSSTTPGEASPSIGELR